MSKKGCASRSNDEHTASSARHNGASTTVPAKKPTRSLLTCSSFAALASRSTQSSAKRQNAYSAYTLWRLQAGSSENAR